ncbi:MAG: hypothetical protein AAF409_14085, partial [Pseudomonadota bacterium]
MTERDLFRLDLAAGDTVRVGFRGVDHDTGAEGALSDPYLRVFDGSSTLIASNDDGGVGLNSELVFTAGVSGDYYLEAGSWQEGSDPAPSSGFAGEYEIDVQVAAVRPASGPVRAIQGLTSLDTADPVLVYFARWGDQYTAGSTTYTATGVNAYEQTQLWSIFEGVEGFIDVDFEITTNRAEADLEWATAALPSYSNGTLLGFFYFPSSSGEGGFGILNDNGRGFPYWNASAGGTLDTGGFMYGVAV